MNFTLNSGFRGGLCSLKQDTIATVWTTRHATCRSQRRTAGTILCDTTDLTAEVHRSSQPAPSAPTSTQLSWRMGAKVIPHPNKVSYGGEDAFFVSSVGGGALGVADGVGGWSEQGINPAEYARTFMHLACSYLEGKSVHPVTPDDLTQALADAPSSANASMEEDDAPLPIASTSHSVTSLSSSGALAAAHAGTRLPGSSTACVIRLNRERRALSAANVGDSGFLLARNGHIVYRSESLQHFFDCPFQFAAAPEYSELTDHVESASLVELELTPGDVIVAGTDGMWDNLPQQELLGLLPTSPDRAMEAAERIAQAASAHANDEEFNSPYAQEAVRQGIDLPWWEKLATSSFKNNKFQIGKVKGGKLDDITVVVAVVEDVDITPASPPSRSASQDSAGSALTSPPESDASSGSKASSSQPSTEDASGLASHSSGSLSNGKDASAPPASASN